MRFLSLSDGLVLPFDQFYRDKHCEKIDSHNFLIRKFGF